ncbi:PAS domain S-box protein [Paenibacillus alkaliterrae]|uniref:PAS domain S-box protein n=1 Tax=Paenibacillus alkaliterrae TaxID=320909 RepID=UPI001F388CC1|nr:PAS domain S-box protein [Paenibacillus alkaliterrae]MCF2937340.1 PAS domain S-box protein [Paenibacillus alkaliterrae]
MDHYKNLFELSFDMMIILDRDGNVIDCNSRMKEMLGLSNPYFRLEDFSANVHPEDLEFAAAMSEYVLDGAQATDVKFRLLHANGSYIWIQWNASMSKDAEFFYFIGRDITAQQEYEANLVKQETWYRSCLDNLIDCFGYYSAIRDDEGHIIDFRVEYVNEASCRTNNYTKEQVIGRTLSELFPASVEELFQIFRHVTETGETVHKRSFAYSDVSMEGIYDILYYKMGDGFANCWHNVTEQMRAQEHLLESNMKFASAFYTNATMNFIVDMQDGNITEANEKFLKTVSEEQQARLGLDILKATCMKKVLKNHEMSFNKATGEIGSGMFSGEPFRMNEKEYFIVFATDVTDLRKAEKNLVLFDKFNLLSSMAASIAHEVRNPMTTIKGFLQLMGKNSAFQAREEIITLMVSELDRANGIISEYLSLANTRFVSKEYLQLNQIIEQLLPLLEADAAINGIDVVIDLQADKSIFVDQKEIRQLLLNLTRNAIQAMNKGGILTIRTRKINGFVNLEVIDQGHGIPNEAHDSIFTPFYSTKESGTGLGLAVCRSIADHHGATIHFESDETGTTFRVEF